VRRLRSVLEVGSRRSRPAAGLEPPRGRGNFIGGLLPDLRFVLRGLRRNLGFAAVVIMTLAIGIGITTSVFAVIDAVLLRPLPYEAPGRLVSLRQQLPGVPEVRYGLSPANLRDVRQLNRVFTGVAAIGRPFPNDRANLTGGDDPVQVGLLRASAELFEILGVDAVVGRTFRPEDDEPGAPAVAIVSYGLWQRAFGGDPEVIGTAIRLDDEPHVLIGVTPRDFLFAYPNIGGAPDVWLPRPIAENAWNNRSNASFGAIARLLPGSTLEQARSDVANISAALAEQYPEEFVVSADWSPTGRDEVMTVPVESFQDEVTQSTRLLLLSLLGGGAVVLLVACVNVAGLLLARAVAREPEMLLRAAIGAGRARLGGQVLAESAVLAAFGGIAGLVLAHWLTDVIVAAAPSMSFYNASLPLLSRIEMNAGVMRMWLATCVVAALCCGLLPSLRAARIAPHVGLRGAHGSRSRRPGTTGGGRLLAAAQVALTIMVLIAAGLLTTTLNHLRAIPLGFEPAHSQVMRAKLSRSRFTQQVPGASERGVWFSMRSERARLVRDVVQRLESRPEIEAAGAVDILPLSFVYSGPVHLEGVEPIPDDVGNVGELDGLPITGQALMQEATPGAFRALGIPLLRGRTFSWADDAAAVPVAVVNRRFEQQFGIDGATVGRRALIRSGGAWRPVEIIGVVDDVLNERYAGRWFNEGYRGYATVYVHYARPPVYGLNYVDTHLQLNFVARHRGEASIVAAAMAEIFRELAPETPIATIESLHGYAATPLADRRFFSWIMGSLALVSLLLALIGVYGVMAFDVGRRVHEVGVRMALGAEAASVVRMIAGEGFRIALLGALLGLLGALATTRLLESWLYEVSPTDPFVFTALPIAMVAVALVACWIPARRAARVDPIESLRAE
jgi:predicted permease